MPRTRRSPGPISGWRSATIRICTRINQAYGDIKAMRRDERDAAAHRTAPPPQTPDRPKPLVVGAILAAVVTFFLVRLLLDILFGG